MSCPEAPAKSAGNAIGLFSTEWSPGTRVSSRTTLDVCFSNGIISVAGKKWCTKGIIV